MEWSGNVAEVAPQMLFDVFNVDFSCKSLLYECSLS